MAGQSLDGSATLRRRAQSCPSVRGTSSVSFCWVVYAAILPRRSTCVLQSLTTQSFDVREAFGGREPKMPEILRVIGLTTVARGVYLAMSHEVVDVKKRGDDVIIFDS